LNHKKSFLFSCPFFFNTKTSHQVKKVKPSQSQEWKDFTGEIEPKFHLPSILSFDSSTSVLLQAMIGRQF